MKYNKAIFFYLLLVPFLASSCLYKDTCIINYSKKDFKNAPTKLIETGWFDEIYIDGPCPSEYVQSPDYKVELKGNTALFDSVICFKKDKTLYLSLESGNYSDLWLNVIVHAPCVKSVSFDGPGHIKLGNINFNKDFKIIFEGPGTIEADTIQCNLFDVKGSGPGRILIKKLESKSRKIDFNGPGHLKIGL